MQIDLKNTILYATGKKLKVYGGLGLDIENRVIILETNYKLASEAQRLITDLLIRFFRLDQAETGGVKLTRYEGNYISKILVTHKYENEEGEECSQVTPLYFDIALAHSNTNKSLEEGKSKDELIDRHNEANDLQSNKHFKANNFINAVALAITHGPSDFEAVDLTHMYDIDAKESEAIYATLDECGFLQPSVHEYYQKHFGHIYPDGYWEIIW